MSSFSTIACYAALTACSKSDILYAYARMVAALVKKKRYLDCKADVMSKDFLDLFGIPLPYHPMCTVINECIKMGLMTYNTSVHQRFPNYECIDREDFMDIVEIKELEFRKMIKEFGDYLSSAYKIFSSDDDLVDRVHAFIERYGIKTAVDKSVLRKVKDDFFFADFLVFCEENGKEYVVNYMDEYIVGLALSEVFTYCERPEQYTAKGTNVYLDTGILFTLFGIESSDRVDGYKDFVFNMRRLGMRIKAYEHTVNEMIGIIESSKTWIGNPNYDAALSSEAAHYFVSHNWTIEQVDELSCSIRTRLTDEYLITIDKMPYPKLEDIRVPTEAVIREMIVSEYRENGTATPIENMDYSIDQDAKSIFFTQHLNDTVVPYHINDVKNIFITTNRSLSRVGYKLSYELAGAKDYFIPTVMTDIKWGTLIWFASPADVSSINKPRLVSAAYAAFRPSPALTRKLNASLSELEEQGSISPARCYLLKVNPIAQRLLAKKTSNDPEKYIGTTPFEILQELEKDAYAKGSLSRQEEVDKLAEEKKNADIRLAIEKQHLVIAGKQKQYDDCIGRIEAIKTRRDELDSQLDELVAVRKEINKIVVKKVKHIKLAFSIIAVLLIGFAGYVGYKQEWVLSVASIASSMLFIIIALWKNENVSILSVVAKRKNRIYNKQCSLRRFSEQTFQLINTERAELDEKLKDEQDSCQRAFTQLENEKAKIDYLSIDISLVTQ